MPKFTKGPWSIKSERWVIATRGDHEGEILVSPTYWMEQAKEEAHANAQLISGAPDMYEALTELAVMGEQGMTPRYDEWLTFHDKVAQIARAALAKAEGKS